jgi:SagB-type dehydrogenase family enzyme
MLVLNNDCIPETKVMTKPTIATQREFLKDKLRLQINFQLTDQNQGIEPPPLQKPPRKDQQLIPLPDSECFTAFTGTDLIDAIARRQSRRRFREDPLSQTELALLLWSTQGVRARLGPGSALRTVPSAGCRHAFESYLLVGNIAGLSPGLYRYLPLDHALVFEHAIDNLSARLARATLGQAFIAMAPVTFAWTVLPGRMEWRYHTAAHRVILMDVGHLCQNLYLACEAIGAGTCAIAAYHQQLMDELLGVDGGEEFTLYLAPVGKV